MIGSVVWMAGVFVVLALAVWIQTEAARAWLALGVLLVITDEDLFGGATC